MAKQVILTPTALADFENVVQYLIYKWGDKVADNFITRFDEVIEILSKNAHIYPYLDLVRQVQRCVVTKHDILYFKETDDRVIVFTVFDTRQNPEKLANLL